MEKIINAAGYIRVSTVEQSLKGLSIETQIAEIEAYAKYHNMKLVDIYIDRGITARKSLEKRMDFMRMMGDVQQGKINHIIVLRLDRFFRNIYDYHKMMNEYLTPNNCDWSAVKEDYTTTTTNGRLMINLRLAIAEQECDTDSDRIKDVLSHRASQGFAISGSLPLGLKIVDHRVVPDEENAHIVQDAFNTFELNNSVRKTLLCINEKYGTRIYYNPMRKILTHRLYIGEYRDNKEYCEPIITREQFENVQRLLKMNSRKRVNNNTYVFSALCVCEHCGNKMVGNHIYSSRYKKEYKYYRCNKFQKERLCDNTQALSENYLEEYLLDNVERLLSDYIISVEVSEQETPQQKSNKKTIEKKLRRLNDLYVNGFIDMKKYKADYDDLQNQIIYEPEKTKKDLTVLKKFLQSNFKEVLYTTLTDEEKQALWRSVIKEIRVSGKEIKDIKFL